jgi:small-conductance mechanosensitive channel
VLVAQVALWLTVIVYVTGRFAALRAISAVLGYLLDMALNNPLFTYNEKSYTALQLLILPAVLVGLWLIVSAIGFVVRSQILRGTERGVQDTVTLILRGALMFVGTIVVLQAWGIELRSLALFASVVGVGIGFGMQNIVNNFISGLIVSFERPIQPGDFITIGGWDGTVERIGGRSTEIRTVDQVTILVPNSKILESDVINWTHRDPLSRIRVPIGVAYGSNQAQVCRVLLEAAQHHPLVVDDPKPRVELRTFGESALDFELLVWTRDPRQQGRLKSDLNLRIEALFRREGIQIPFPQRDMRLHAPQLERVVSAWARQNLPEADLTPPAAPAHDSSAPSVLDLELGPRAWSDEQVDTLVARMRAEDGIPIADRRHLFKSYRRCFEGRDAVKWMVERTGLSRDDAIVFGQLLVERGMIHHVLDEHGFKDGHYYYRFYADEES